MKKPTDQELDAMFKSAAEGFEPAFDATAWEAMNEKLDQPKVVPVMRWIYISILGLIIFSSGVWVGYQLTKKSKQSTPSAVNLMEEKSLASKSSDESLSDRQLALNRKESSTTSKTEKVVQEGASVNDSRKRRVQQVTITDDIENRDKYDVAYKADMRDSTSELVQVIGINENINVADHQELDDIDTLKNERAEVHMDTVQVGEPERKVKEEWTDARSFYFRLLISPDISTIKNSSSTPMGGNYALLLDYQFSKRLSVSTGAIWSYKKYATDQEITYGKYTADRMKGNCRVLDIPLNVYYHFPVQSRFSVYTGLGLSSYIMLDEDYVFTFDLPSGTRDFTFSYERKNQEWFKMLNISLGVQYGITSRFQVIAEPFFKTPLSGIGEWNVDLSSMGIFMGLKYKIN